MKEKTIKDILKDLITSEQEIIEVLEPFLPPAEQEIIALVKSKVQKKKHYCINMNCRICRKLVTREWQRRHDINQAIYEAQAKKAGRHDK